jgi:hypothetical protein
MRNRINAAADGRNGLKFVFYFGDEDRQLAMAAVAAPTMVLRWFLVMRPVWLPAGVHPIPTRWR